MRSGSNVKEILHTALEVPRADRAAYLDRTCDGNADLHCEVESLLASHDDAGTFLEEPAPPVPSWLDPMGVSYRYSLSEAYDLR